MSRICIEIYIKKNHEMKENRGKAGQSTKAIDTILHRNYEILKSLGEGQCKREELTSRGFNFQHFTEIKNSARGIRCFFVYDFGYAFSGKGEELQIIKL